VKKKAPPFPKKTKKGFRKRERSAPPTAKEKETDHRNAKEKVRKKRKSSGKMKGQQGGEGM